MNERSIFEASTGQLRIGWHLAVALPRGQQPCAAVVVGDHARAMIVRAHVRHIGSGRGN
jgi:hypothetical protein